MLKIFNTLTGKKEIFKPIKKKYVNLYVCGITVYDFCHIGHGRTFIIFDMLVRYLRYSNYKVKYVRNITDIDDKIIAKSIQENINIHVLTDKMIQAMNRDFSLLGLLNPNIEPRVTHCMNKIISSIYELLKNNNAYINNHGDVLFSVKSDINYGTLSHQSLNFLKSGFRIPINNMKRNPLDFILWKKSNKTEISWDSPWGKGRPGWHIECSSIIDLYFENTLDIHGGGSDLLFPHHENERSQSACLSKKLKINFWMHSGMVIINNKKMSKSLGNTYLLRDLLSNYDSETIRYFFLSTHYRHPIYYDQKNLNKARLSLESLYISLLNTTPTFNFSEGINFENEFYSSMNDDLNTPKAFGILFKIARKINILKKNNIFKANLLAFRLCSLANSLGFLLQKPENFLQKKNFFNSREILNIEKLIKKRNIFREKKSWREADEIRNKLISLGIIIEDFSKTTIWRKK